VVQEIDRLDLIITQINNFAHPPELNFKPIDLRAPMKKAIELVRARTAKNGFAVETAVPDDLPPIVGDETALAEAFAHLVANAAEATSGLPKGKNHSFRQTDPRRGSHQRRGGDGARQWQGHRGRFERQNLFPILYHQAARNGARLPIVKRTVFDHNGRVDIDSNPQGTSVSVLLPVAENGH
jgi:nitrogen fixation/metabolism regulation signal transduction histidine kinase